MALRPVVEDETPIWFDDEAFEAFGFGVIGLVIHVSFYHERRTGRKKG